MNLVETTPSVRYGPPIAESSTAEQSRIALLRRDEEQSSTAFGILGEPGSILFPARIGSTGVVPAPENPFFIEGNAVSLSARTGEVCAKNFMHGFTVKEVRLTHGLKEVKLVAPNTLNLVASIAINQPQQLLDVPFGMPEAETRSLRLAGLYYPEGLVPILVAAPTEFFTLVETEQPDEEVNEVRCLVPTVESISASRGSVRFNQRAMDFAKGVRQHAFRIEQDVEEQSE